MQPDVIPELEAIILKVDKLANLIDAKVTDKNMPPKTMTQQEAVQQLTKTNETLVKVSNETDALLREIEALKQALADAGGPGGTITPDLAPACAFNSKAFEAAINAVGIRATSIDKLVPDVPQPEK